MYEQEITLYLGDKYVFENLSREKAGDLIRHIFRYVAGELDEENEDPDDEVLYFAWMPIKFKLQAEI